MRQRRFLPSDFRYPLQEIEPRLLLVKVWLEHCKLIASCCYGMAESTSPSRLEVEFPACPVRFVVVYPDRAEVTREVKVQLVAGEHEIVLKGTSKALDK